MTLSLLFVLNMTGLTAQESAQPRIPADSAVQVAIASTADSLAVSPSGQATDSADVSSSMAVDLMLEAQSADMEASLRESILNEQLKNTDNQRQKKLIEEQLAQLYMTDSMRRAEQQHRIDSLKQVTAGSPVTLRQDTIYYIYTGLGSFTAFDRARLNSKKILDMARSFSMSADSLYIAEGAATSDIMYGEDILASVTDNDAMWFGMPRAELALKYAADITDSVAAYKKSVGVWNILKMAGSCVLLIALVYLLFKGIRYLFGHIVKRAIVRKKNKWFKGLKIKNLEVLNQHRQMQMMVGIARIVKWIFYFLLLYLSIPVLFSIFPATKHIANTIFGWVLNPVKGILSSLWDFLPDLFKIVVTLVVVRYVVKFLKYIAREIESGNLVIPGFYPDWTKSTLTIVRMLIYVFALIIVFPLLPGSESPVFKGVSAFMGLILSLGSTGVISNLMAGLVITYMRPFVKGDRIRIGETSGDVIEKTPFVVRIQTVKNEVVTVPNSAVLSANVVNYSAKSKDMGLIINSTVTMGYEVPWKQVNELLIDAALRTKLVERSPAPFVLQTSLNDFSASYQINAYTKEAGLQALIYSDLHKNIQDVFRGAGIEMVMPHYQAIRDGNASVVPPEYKGKGTVYKDPTPGRVIRDARNMRSGTIPSYGDSSAAPAEPAQSKTASIEGGGQARRGRAGRTRKLRGPEKEQP